MLDAFIITHRDLIIERTRAKVASRTLPRPTEHEIEHGVPLFLSQLTDRLRTDLDANRGHIGASATQHGAELLRSGYTIGQVVHDYGDICQVITELAGELSSQISNDEFRILNLSLDIAIADAVTEYARQREATISAAGVEHLGALAHELRNYLNAATLAYEVVRKGSVGSQGSTSRLLGKNLDGMRALIDRSLAEVRVEGAGGTREDRVGVASVLEDIEIAAMSHADPRTIQLAIEPAPPGLAVLGDAQLVGSILTNLVHNAYKFSRDAGRIQLTTRAVGDRVFIDVADECGGLPPGAAETLFQPYQQRGTDRSGLGLGLSISRKAAHAMGGEVTVRDVPGTGCVFTLDLRRADAG